MRKSRTRGFVYKVKFVNDKLMEVIIIGCKKVWKILQKINGFIKFACEILLSAIGGAAIGGAVAGPPGILIGSLCGALLTTVIYHFY